MSNQVLSNQVFIDRAVSSKLDADGSISRQIQETCDQLKFDGRILPVKEFRDDLKLVREKTQDGNVVIIAEGGKVRDESEATMVMSVKTFHTAMADVIARVLANAAKRRIRPADFIRGLPRVPKEAALLEVDLSNPPHHRPAGSELDFKI